MDEEPDHVTVALPPRTDDAVPAGVGHHLAQLRGEVPDYVPLTPYAESSKLTSNDLDSEPTEPAKKKPKSAGTHQRALTSFFSPSAAK
jgi:hypothetical protein